MRVIAGTAKGFGLKCLSDERVRPTADKVKGAMFSMVAQQVYHSTVLDLFAGSGALGIEALSRGAKRAVFVDQSREAINLIKDNLEHTRLVGEVAEQDALTFLTHTKEQFDLIFIDPPYAANLAPAMLEEIHKRQLLKAGGIAVVEFDRAVPPSVPDGFMVLKEKYYGRVGVLLVSAEKTE